MTTKTFDIEKTSDEKPIFLLSIDETFIDYEFSFSEIVALRDRLTLAINQKGGRS
jgi:hypothetical protein